MTATVYSLMIATVDTFGRNPYNNLKRINPTLYEENPAHNKSRIF